MFKLIFVTIAIWLLPMSVFSQKNYDDVFKAKAKDLKIDTLTLGAFECGSLIAAVNGLTLLDSPAYSYFMFGFLGARSSENTSMCIYSDKIEEKYTSAFRMSTLIFKVSGILDYHIIITQTESGAFVFFSRWEYGESKDAILEFHSLEKAYLPINYKTYRIALSNGFTLYTDVFERLFAMVTANGNKFFFDNYSFPQIKYQ